MIVSRAAATLVPQVSFIVFNAVLVEQAEQFGFEISLLMVCLLVSDVLSN